MFRRIFVVLPILFMLVHTAQAEVPPEAPKSPKPLNMTFQQFVDTYNALPTVTRKLGVPTDKLKQVFGLVSMPAGDQQDVYVQLSYNQQKDAVQFAGVVTQEEDSRLDYEGFLLVCDHLMEIVFSEMSEADRNRMLMQVILCGAIEGIYIPDGSYEYSEGNNTILYIVREDGERHVVVYKQE